MNEITDIIMKQKTIKIDKATLLAVELPEGAYCPNICQLPPSIGVNYFLYENGVNTPYKESLDIPKGNWQLLGRVPDIMEEQWGGIVEDASYKYPYEFTRKYENYDEGDFDFNCSSESALSLLRANEIYFENKYGDRRPPNLPIDADPYTSKEGYIKFREERKHLPHGDLMVSYEAYCMAWQEAQSKVWDKERTYLFIKVD